MYLGFQVDSIISLYDASNIWRVPLILRVSSVGALILMFLHKFSVSFKKKIFSSLDQDQKAHEAILKVLNLKG